MANRASARFSTYSGAPSLHPSLAPTADSTSMAGSGSNAPNNTMTQSGAQTSTPSNNAARNRASVLYSSKVPTTYSDTSLSPSDPRAQDLQHWSGALARMQDARLEKQRYVMSTGKNEEVSKLALSAKVERALARRMVGQDATFSNRASVVVLNEKM